MSIERNRTSDDNQAARAREADPRTQAREPRQPPNPQKVDEFRALMQAKEGPGKGTGELTRELARKAQAHLATQGSDESATAREAATALVKEQAVTRAEERGESSDALPPADASLLWQAQMALRDVQAPAAAPPPPVNTAAFAELIERHVRQLAVGDGGPEGDGSILLRLADSTLPGTDLLLSRTADGWLLRADVRSRYSFDAISDAAPQLAERFASRNLGTLTVEPHFHG